MKHNGSFSRNCSLAQIVAHVRKVRALQIDGVEHDRPSQSALVTSMCDAASKRSYSIPQSSNTRGDAEQYFRTFEEFRQSEVI